MEEENWDSDGDDWENKNIAYILDKSLENAEVLATSTGEINIYGQDERLSTDSKTSDGINKTVNYVNGNNNSVYGMATTENAWGDIRYKYKAIEYTDYGYSDDIKSGFGYNGEEQDETGLIYLRARYYNPVIGQFIQLDENRGDAGNIESQNRYAYALNNPNKYIDKNGRAARLMNDGGSSKKSGGHRSGGFTGGGRSTQKKATTQMTSQDRYNLWNGSDSWDNYGGKPKGVYATKADYDAAHQKPSTSYKAPQTQDQRNPKAKTASTTRVTYVPEPICDFVKISYIMLGVTLSINNEIADGITKGIRKTINSKIEESMSKLITLIIDPGKFFNDMLSEAISTLTSQRSLTQVFATLLLSCMTGGLSNAITSGIFVGSGEVYDAAKSDFDVEKFLENKGVSDPQEYIGTVIGEYVYVYALSRINMSESMKSQFNSIKQSLEQKLNSLTSGYSYAGIPNGFFDEIIEIYGKTKDIDSLKVMLSEIFKMHTLLNLYKYIILLVIKVKYILHNSN